MENTDIATKYGVQSIPLMVLFKNGEPVTRSSAPRPEPAQGLAGISPLRQPPPQSCRCPILLPLAGGEITDRRLCAERLHPPGQLIPTAPDWPHPAAQADAPRRPDTPVHPAAPPCRLLHSGTAPPPRDPQASVRSKIDGSFTPSARRGHCSAAQRNVDQAIEWRNPALHRLAPLRVHEDQRNGGDGRPCPGGAGLNPVLADPCAVAAMGMARSRPDSRS